MSFSLYKARARAYYARKINKLTKTIANENQISIIEKALKNDAYERS